jgi:plastocyanin
MTRTKAALVGIGGAALLAACGSSGSGGGGTTTTQGTGGGSGFTITIQNMAFSPQQLAVPPGATVTVMNQDGATPHSVTSETADGAFTPGSVGGVQFDTGPFTGQRTFTIPANAQASTVIPFYCTVHKGAMATPNGSIRIDPGATGSTGTTGTGGTTGTAAPPSMPVGGGGY